MNVLDTIKKPVVAAILGFALGLFVGLVVLGWGLWPVEWTNADLPNLRADLQQDYLRMTIDSYIQNGSGGLAATANDELAVQRFQALGSPGRGRIGSHKIQLSGPGCLPALLRPRPGAGWDGHEWGDPG